MLMNIGEDEDFAERENAGLVGKAEDVLAGGEEETVAVIDRDDLAVGEVEIVTLAFSFNFRVTLGRCST